NSNRPLNYSLIITYSDIQGNNIPEQVIPLDLSVYRNLPAHPESEIDKLVKAIEKLTRSIGK
ncbi:MAG: hypothetical protein V1780_01805, partial [Chloroflexota bacterium]